MAFRPSQGQQNTSRWSVVVFFGISDAFGFKASTRGLERSPFLLCCYAAISIPITAFV
jgi:hypothetical protein